MTNEELTKLRKALDVYNAAKDAFAEAKRVYNNTLENLEEMRKEARAIFELEREKLFGAGEVFTKFTDENPDPDDEEDEEE